MAAVIGGAKVSTKIPVLTNLVAKVDKLIIGGGMANTFLLAQGVNIGKSLAEPDFAGTALEIMHAAKARSCEVVLPADVVVAREVRGRRRRTRVPRTGDARRPDDPRRRSEGCCPLHGRTQPLQHAAVERTARGLRDRAVRRRYFQAGAGGGRSHQGRQAGLGCRRRRHGCCAQRGRCHGSSSPTCPLPAAPFSNGWRGGPSLE